MNVGNLGPEISAYELDRGKPPPSLHHAIVQGNLIAQLGYGLADGYIALPELHLAIGSAPPCPTSPFFVVPTWIFRLSKSR